MNSSISTHHVTIELNEPPEVVIERVKLSARLAGMFSTALDMRYSNVAKQHLGNQSFLFGIEAIVGENEVYFTPTVQVKLNTVDDTMFITDFEYDKSNACYVASGVIKIGRSDVAISFKITTEIQEVKATVVFLD